MTDIPPKLDFSTPEAKSADNSDAKALSTQPGVLKCLMGAVMAGAIATAMYLLTSSIAQTFASKPLHSTNAIVLRIGVAVRTLVVGASTLATFVFGLAALGLLALAIQTLIQRTVNHQPPTTNYEP